VKAKLSPAEVLSHTEDLHKVYGETMTMQNITDFCKSKGIPAWPLQSRAYQLRRGAYTFKVEKTTSTQKVAVQEPVVAVTPKLEATYIGSVVKIGRVMSDLPESCVPRKDPRFVPFGDYRLVETAINSKRFFCIFIAGESGNGKTTMPEQACAKTQRELITVQITKATTEQDLIGDFRLVNGETPFYYGPVAEAMRRGAVLLLDELTQCDSGRIMCLQSIMAGKALYIKKTGEVIYPAPGFCVVCTGNSIGEGDESSGQVYSNEEILNEAFRDRITAVINHTYPPKPVEVKILQRHLATEHADFAENLVKWANLTRENYKRRTVDRQITTRRLLHVVDNFLLFDDKILAIDLALNRFPAKIADSFRSSYFVIDPTVDPKKLQASIPMNET